VVEYAGMVAIVKDNLLSGLSEGFATTHYNAKLQYKRLYLYSSWEDKKERESISLEGDTFRTNPNPDPDPDPDPDPNSRRYLSAHRNETHHFR